MTNVVITGGAGFIGSNLVYECLKLKPEWTLHVVDSLTYAGNFSNIASVVDEKKVFFHKADITNLEAMKELFDKIKVDFVFHLAAESHVDRSIKSAAEFVKTNIDGTQVLVDVARANSVKRFLHVSTDEVYGALGDDGVFTEETPLNPTSPYAASKASSDLMALSAFKTYGFDVIVTRCTNNYGPYQFPEKFLPLFITNTMENKELPLYGEGMQVRSWLHVSDHNRALIKLLDSGKSGNVYNIGPMNESEKTNKEVAHLILDFFGKSKSLIKKVEDRLAHDFRYATSIEKITSDIDWKPVVSFADGLKETIEWYQKNEEWWKKIKSGQYQEYYQNHYKNIA